MSNTEELNDKLGQLINRASELGEEVKAAKATSAEELADTREEMKRIKEEINKVSAEIADSKAKTESEELLKFVADMKDEAQRRPSKAHLIGQPTEASVQEDLNFFGLVAKANSRNIAEATEAQTALREMGSPYAKARDDIKATTGTTDATGGYIIPNNLVSTLIEHATALNPYRQLLTVIRGVRGSAVDVPTEGLKPTRAGITAWGAQKDNVNLTVASYTATLYTLAAIYDVSNQLLRHSEGAAESLVRSRLARSLAQGEAYQILAGSGSSAPKGILTSVGTSGDFVTSFTAATTQAGSIAKAVAKLAGVLADRNRTPDGAILAPSTFWEMASQGTDNAGFFFNPAEGPGQITVNGVPSISVFGIRCFPDANMLADQANVADDLLVGEFGSAQLFIGDDYRVDVSTEANTRWDYNLTGFRAEEEIGFNADPYVVSGHFQRALDVLP